MLLENMNHTSNNILQDPVSEGSVSFAGYAATKDGEFVEWQDPRVNPPPLGVKLVSLSKGGVVVIGNWDKSHLGWHKLLKVPTWLRQRRMESYLGVQD